MRQLRKPSGKATTPYNHFRYISSYYDYANSLLR